MNRLPERNGVFKNILIGDILILQFIYYNIRCKSLNILMPLITNSGSAHFTISVGLIILIFDYTANTQNNNIPHWENWDQERVKILYKHCKTWMKLFGYGEEEEWQKKILPSR